MGISIQIARTGTEIDQAFEVRYGVYVEEEGRFTPSEERRFFDRYDAFPGTYSVIAVDNAKPDRPCVGTVRFAAMEEGVGLPGDAFYDFSEIFEKYKGQGQFATMGMLAVKRRYRVHRGLLLGLCKVAWRELKRRDVRFLVAPVSPETAKFMVAMGANAVGESFMHGDPPVDITPLFLDMEQLNPVFREASIDPHDLLFDELDERRLYSKNERLIEEGATGNEAYLIMRGSVRVLSSLGSQTQTSYTLGPGEIFGELALLDAGPNPATVMVNSRMLDVAVIPRDIFQKKLSSDNEFAQRMLRILGLRIRRLMLNLPPDAMAIPDQEQLLACMLIQASVFGSQPVDSRWLASDTGLPRKSMMVVLERWAQANVVSISEKGQLKVLDVNALQVIVDHVLDAYALSTADLQSVAGM